MRSLIAFVLLPAIAIASNSFQVRVPPHGKDCFVEPLNIGDELSLTFQVYDGGDLAVDFWIAAPDERLIHSVYRQTSNTHTFLANQQGSHTFCFNNVGGVQKAITFSVHGPDERERFDEKYKGSKEDFHSPLNEQIAKLANSLRSVVDENDYILQREATHRATAKSTNRRVLWWSIFESVVLFAVCGFQVYYLVSFFEVKRGRV